MRVTGNDSTLCIEMAIHQVKVMYWFRRVGDQWVKYKRECISRLH
ncbi:hypothetical protein AAIA72_04315 [Hahella sp. SMD15-11]|uniref:Uncharacterized protein n=1 Tax=Thermohahella caldifontis TaxID=3142973 RepID=A0AB39UZC5_9GAMM